MPNALLSTRETASRLGLTRYSLYRLVKAGAIAPTKLPGQTGAYVFEPAEVERVAAERAS